MSDPRVERTRAHVLATLQSILEAGGGSSLTFSSLAAEAKVSRRTLYTHWGTVGNLLVDALESYRAPQIMTVGPSARANLRAYLEMVRDSIDDAVVSSALLALMVQESQVAGERTELRALLERWLDQFTVNVAPVTQEQFAQLVGPILMQTVLGHAASPELIDALVDRGIAMLALR